LQLSVRGASEGVLSDTSFIQPMVSGKWIYSFANSTRLIARGSAGITSVTEFDKLPTSLRFFTGGDKTVRGYAYNVIGPSVGGDVVGGKNLLESSLEYEVPVSEKWSIAAFADIGDAFDDSPDYKSGVGLGIHWRSPIGPVRLDFGHALDQPPGKSLRLHLTIGSDL
jgi:translocation and assembly module TamA